MAKTPLLYAFDAGNGACKGLSNERGLVTFEPVIAPLTDKRGLQEADEKPTYSLRVDDQVLVFGTNDVFAHGKRSAIRRLNSQERYTSPDYFRLMQVLYLQVFAGHRGGDGLISPSGVISVPVAHFNDSEVVEEIRNTLAGRHDLFDAEGCQLSLLIEPKRLNIVPESYGALMHYVYYPKTLQRRESSQTKGTTLVIDIGYETTDCSLYEGLHYQRDRAFTIPRAGMGNIARAIQEYARHSLREADISRIDHALRRLAGVAVGQEKKIEASPGVLLDVTELYDAELDAQSIRIAQEVITLYPESFTRLLLGGGGAYHMVQAITRHMEPLQVIVAPDPDAANVYGAFTMLNIEVNRR